jgi:hypothetical protein
MGSQYPNPKDQDHSLTLSVGGCSGFGRKTFYDMRYRVSVETGIFEDVAAAGICTEPG